MKRLTDYDKLECAEYTLDILERALTEHGVYKTETRDWLCTARDECAKQRAQYLESEDRADPGGEL